MLIRPVHFQYLPSDSLWSVSPDKSSSHAYFCIHRTLTTHAWDFIPIKYSKISGYLCLSLGQAPVGAADKFSILIPLRDQMHDIKRLSEPLSGIQRTSSSKLSRLIFGLTLHMSLPKSTSNVPISTGFGRLSRRVQVRKRQQVLFRLVKILTEDWTLFVLRQPNLHCQCL